MYSTNFDYVEAAAHQQGLEQYEEYYELELAKLPVSDTLEAELADLQQVIFAWESDKEGIIEEHWLTESEYYQELEAFKERYNTIRLLMPDQLALRSDIKRFSEDVEFYQGIGDVDRAHEAAQNMYRATQHYVAA